MHRHTQGARARLKLGLLCGVAAALLATQALAGDKPVEFNIAAQDAGKALNEFSRQSGMAVLFPYDAVAGKRAPAVSGRMAPAEALNILLAGTGLVLVSNDGDTVALAQPGEGGSGPQDASAGDVDALIVTAQKKEEAIQDVPIAISAFTQKSLEAQKIEGGFDLLKAIPNVTFSKTNFTGYNFSIRGIGTKAIAASTDPGVAVAFNNSGLIVNRLFEQEYFDVERVEVLRGPQGTLYGRNATSGVINVISAKPRLMEFEADVKAETGGYNARRLRGMVNVPLGDTIAIRAAGAITQRDGYGTNLIDGSDVDGRALWSSRITAAFEPNEGLRATLLWEHFEEDDNRVRTSKQLCHTDPGPSEVLGVPVSDFRIRATLSQGCLPGSLYDEGAFGTPLGNSLQFVIAALLERPDDIFYGTQSHDLREIESTIEPQYRANSDIFDLTIDVDVTDSLTMTSQTLYTQDEVYSTQDLNRFRTKPIFLDSTTQRVGDYVAAHDPYFRAISPGGLFCDPQLGCSDTLVGQDISTAESTQFNQEFRLASNFDGAVNFSVGTNYTYFETLNDYYVFINLLTYIAHVREPFFAPGGFTSVCTGVGILCIYEDPNPLESIDGDGHNYFRSKNPYRLTSSALFGELYWQVTPTVKITAGARMTWDRKDFTPVPSQTLLSDYRETGLIEGSGGTDIGPGDPPEACISGSPLAGFCTIRGTAVGGRGYPAEPDIVQEWAEPTGRLVVDWKPALAFTDETMLYASASRGYKGGGANPPGIAKPARLFNERGREAAAPATFDPEFINAYEIGTKNTLFGGALVVNAGAFYYDYEGYQVSKIVDRTSINENFDAEVWGAELEWIFAPSRALRFNGTVGYLDTKVGEGEQSIDLMDRTQGNPDFIVVKGSVTSASNCVVPTELYAIGLANGAEPGSWCPAGNLAGHTYWNAGNFASGIPGTGGRRIQLDEVPNGGAGIFAELAGNELPNAPHWTASLGAQYRFDLPAGWEGTLRSDLYWQSQSYARIYNTQYDKLRAWTNANISLWVEKPDWGVTAEVYVKNVFDETPITDAFLFSDDTGLVTNVFTLDPRLVGVSVRKSF